MNNSTQDILEMLDTLKLPIAVQRFNELLYDPDLAGYSPVQFLRELLLAQYGDTMNHRFITNLRLSSLINKSAKIENLKTGKSYIQ